MSIEILSAAEIGKMKRAGRAAAETLAHVGKRVRPGITTGEIERWVREDTARRGGQPSQLGYKGFPAAVCTSRNEIVCHGIPDEDEILIDGDIENYYNKKHNAKYNEVNVRPVESMMWKNKW